MLLVSWTALILYPILVIKACKSLLGRGIWIGVGAYVFFFQPLWVTAYFILADLLLIIGGALMEVDRGIKGKI